MSIPYGPASALVYERHWTDFARQAGPAMARMLRAIGIRSGRVVDLGCGTGHVALALSRRGYDVLGIDNSRSVVALARRRAPRARFLVTRLQDVKLPRGVEAIVSTFDTINYMLDPKDVLRLFQRVRRALRPGGVFLFDLSTRLALERRSGKVQVRRLPNLFLVLEGSYDPDTSLAPLRLTGFVKQGATYTRFEEEHLQRAYEQEEIEELMHGSGLVYEQLGGYWECPDVKSRERLFYLARPS